MFMRPAQLLFAVAIIISFGSLVQATIPQVSFNYSPLVIDTSTNITFTPIINSTPDLNELFWGFDTDGNINYYNNTDFNQFYTYAFANGIGDWTVETGSISTADGNAVNTGATYSRISNLKPLSTSADLLFQTTAGGELGTDIYYGIKNQSGLITDGNGYYMWMSVVGGSSTARLIKVENGSSTDIINQSTTIAVDQLHTFIATRAPNGNWRLFIDGGQVGTPSNETTFSDFNYVVAELDAGQGFIKDVNISGVNVLNPIDNNKQETFQFTTPGTKNVCLTGINADGSDTSCEQITVNASWYDGNWPFRIPITIEMDEDISNYQVLVDINESFLGDSNASFWSNTQNDGDDVLFTNSGGELLLNFWREQWTEDVNAEFWVNVPTLTSGSNTIYMYYGNPSASSDSNFLATFSEVEDFNSVTNFSQQKDAGTDWSSNGAYALNTSTTGTQYAIRSYDTNNAKIFAAQINLYRQSSSTELRWRFLPTSITDLSRTALFWSGASTAMFQASGEGGPSCNLTNSTTGDFVTFTLTRGYDGKWEITDGTSSCGVLNVDDTNAFGFGMVHSGGASSEARVDEYYLRNFPDVNEATYSFGALEFFGGEVGLKIVDEETGTGLQASVLVNGSSVSVDGSGNFDVNVDSASFPLTITASLTGYDTRTFSFLTSAGLIQDNILGLRDANEAQNINFKYYAPNEVDLLSNRYIVVRKGSIVSGRAKTDNEGKLLFNLAPQDETYEFYIYEIGTDADTNNIEYNYSPIQVTVQIPKDEKTNSTIVPPNYDITGSGLANVSQINLTTAGTFYVLPNTIQTYDIKIDDNNSVSDNYFARFYSLYFKGNPLTYSLQPYLIKAEDGIAVNFTIRDKITQEPLPNLLGIITRPIAGQTTIVEQRKSSAAGIIQFIFLAQTTYELTIIDTNTDITYFPTGNADNDFSSAVQTYNIDILFNPTSLDQNNFDLNIIIQPFQETISGTTGTIDVNVQTNYANNILISLLDGNRLVNSFTTTNQDLNAQFIFTLNDFNGFATISVQVSNFFGTNTYIRTYNLTPTSIGLLEDIEGVKNKFGVIAGLIITVLAVLLVLQAAGPGLAGNNESQLFLGGLVLAIFSLFFFLEPNTIIGTADPMIPLYAAMLFGIIGWWWIKG